MVMSKHLTHFCYTIRLVHHQHLNLQVANPGIPPEIRTTKEGNISTCHRSFSDYSDQSLINLIHQKEEDFFSGKLVLSNFNQRNLRKRWQVTILPSCVV